MNTTHHGAPSWKVELSEATNRLSAKIEIVCVKLANHIARGLHKIGLHDVVDLFSSP